ncbi:hypothetical protein [Azohydromonas lata]|uniref:Uncharacterized protein n=1 Tax=Azohydromonas lata TaxID=45677 RepID=A0ABU5IF33_9BURK|nr:hypothetical protein [Azohydromonas lata]MDZ5457434.1 hypothetical protein [Azohydromonas lata]
MEPHQVTVYSFDVFDVDGRNYMPFKATREEILSRYGGQLIEGTAETVPLDALDDEGHYRRWSGGWTEQHFALLRH